ncbi:carotenoid oxygenase family protein [Bradyrhizobium sp.]|uniref:carotenoid oxygenase family protein n=1 Tax=Bradyrhizobium sp. TaxID=376 RepID=UPI0025C1011E|nr:carotenoid oxygenase family protein [Bradyrhizobium sp.]
MQQQMPARPARSNLGPIPFECDAPFLKVTGELPRGLDGTLYRNGPNPQFEAPGGAHWFVGDGMLHAFHLEGGRASYRNRWVRTPKWLAEHDAGRALFAGFGRKLPDAPADVTDGGVANTNIIFHAGRLLALEEAHLPTEIEPRTLATRGYDNYGGRIAGPFTAHPKIDPVTGELVFFGYNAAGPLTPALSFGTIGADGKVKRFERFEAPYVSMVHDFIVTQNHLLFPVLPLTGSMARAINGQPPYAWEPDKGAHVGIMKRNGSAADIAWFRGESCYVFHVMNAWEDGSRIIADVMQFEEAPLFPHPDGSPTDPAKARARLCRWTFDLAGNTDRFTQDYLDDLTGEFPRIDDRRAGLTSSHGWYACANPDLPPAGRLNGVVHVDGRGSRRGHYLLPVDDTLSEPVFVPRDSKAAEGDGWLLTVVWRARDNVSDLAVFNATDVEAGPVALVHLGHRVPDGFHGNWVSAD